MLRKCQGREDFDIARHRMFPDASREFPKGGIAFSWPFALGVQFMIDHCQRLDWSFHG